MTTATELARRDARPSRFSPAVRLIVLQIALGGIYYVAARLSLHLALIGRSVTPLWPPTGIALVGFIWFGYRVAPAVAIAAFLVNWGIGPSAEAAGLIAVGNTLAPAVSAALLRVAGFHPTLDRTRDAMALVVLGALGAMTISATVGTLTLRHFAPAIARHDFWSTWAVWWAGDAMGILAVAPFLLGVPSIRMSNFRSAGRIAEAILLVGLFTTTVILIDTTEHHFLFATFPVLVLIVWRLGQQGAGLAALIAIVAASWAAAHNSGPFSGTGLVQKMVTLQAFNAAVALLSFFFAAVVAERADARRKLEEAAEQLYEREHRIATTLQRSLLPEGIASLPDVEVSARYIPADDEMEVGGDWYDVIQLPDGRLCIAIGDVAGHGVEAAAVMGQLRMAMRAYALQQLSPTETMYRLNTLAMQLRAGAMATLTFGHLDPESGSFSAVKAGHPPPLILDADGSYTFMSGSIGPPLGVNPAALFDPVTIELPFDSTLFLYTDGLVERRGEPLEHGLERLARAAADGPRDVQEIPDHLVASLIGNSAPDDAAILVLRRRSFAGVPLEVDIPATPANLVWLRQVMKRWLRQNGAGETEVGEILLACTEACSNTIQHAYRSEEGRLEIRAIPEGGDVALSIRDFGAWRPAPPASLKDGRGILLMKELMDSVSVVSNADGTRVAMRRRLEGQLDHV